MITFDTFYTIQHVSGLSQDDKPLGMKPGSIFMELDTGKTFIFDGETWHEQPSGAVTTLHINVTAANLETMEATFTADKTPEEMKQASVNGPIWCVVTFAAGIMSEESMSIGVPPALGPINTVAFGSRTLTVHDQVGENDVFLAVSGTPMDRWYMELQAFGGD